MATRKRRIPGSPSIPIPREPRLPDIPTTPRIPQPRGPAPRIPSRTKEQVSRALQASVKKVIKGLTKRLKDGETNFYAMGKELRALDRPEVWTAFGEPSFRAFVQAHVMSYERAHLYMLVADSYPQQVAIMLGVNKAFHLVQYAKVAKTQMTARKLAEDNRKIGPGRVPVSELSAADVQTLVRLTKMGAAKASKAKPTSAEKKAAVTLAKQFEERFGMDARVKVDKTRDLIRIEVKLSDWMS